MDTIGGAKASKGGEQPLMLVKIIRKAGASILVILGSITLVFYIVQVLPGDVATMLAGDHVPTEVVDQLRAELGLDRPVAVQYVSYILELARGNLGTSYVNGESVARKLFSNLSPTLALTLSSTLVAVALGLTMGVLSAVYRYKWVDSLIRVISLVGVCTPNFWIGILLIFIFSVQFNLLPAIGNGSWRHLILPSIGLGVSGAGVLARLIRNSMLEVIQEPFIRTLRAKGIAESIVTFKHILRNALLPAVTMLGLIFGEMLAGSVVTETVFSRQGLGRVILDAIHQKDLPVIQGAVMLTACFYVAVHLVIDASYTMIDPRIRKQQMVER